MNRILLTAFQPYGSWSANASWLAMVELTRELPLQAEITTRLYPVDYGALLDRLPGDVGDHYDYVILTGQAPGRARIEIETVALNLVGDASAQDRNFPRLVEEGPVAYRSRLPTASLCLAIRRAGIPAAVSHHAGTYLCNAALYLALHQIGVSGLRTEAVFVHLPLDTSQAVELEQPMPSLPKSLSAQALRIIIHALTDTPQPT